MTEEIQGRREIVEALRAAGIPVNSVWDLVRAKAQYPLAIPVLLDFLPKEMDPRIKEGIVRALTVKEARGIAADALIKEFEKIPDPDSSLKWAIGNALSIVGDDSVAEDLVKLAVDKRHGRARKMLVVALGNLRNPRATDAAISLLGDEEVAGHAIIALRKLNARLARPLIVPFLDNPYAWIRKEARLALKKFDKPPRTRRRSA